MNTLYVRCQTKDYILDIVAARAGMRIIKVNADKIYRYIHDHHLMCLSQDTACIKSPALVFWR